MSMTSIYRESVLVRLVTFIKKATGNSVLLYLLFGAAPLISFVAVRMSFFVRKLAIGATAVEEQVEKAVTALRRGFPGSKAFGWLNLLKRVGASPVLSGSYVVRTLAGIRVESCLWVIFSFVALDYVMRKYFGIPWWNKFVFGFAFVAWPLKIALKGRLTWRLTPMDLPLFIYIAMAVFLFFVRSPVMGVAFEGLRVYVEYMLWFFVASNLLINKKQAYALLNWLVFLGALIGLHGVYQYIVGVPIPQTWVDEAEAAVRTRVFSIVGSPNVLGSFFVLLIPINLSQLLIADNRPKRYFNLICLIPMVASLIFTYSRGAWLAAVVSLIIYALIYNWRLLLALIPVGYVAPKVVPGISTRISYLMSSTYLLSSAKAGRVARWSKAIEVWRNHPLTGEGFGRYGGAVAARNIPGSNYVDNFYLKTLAETGIIGLASFILLLLVGIRCALSSCNRLTDSKLRCLAVGIIAGLCGVLVHNAVENIFEVPMMATYFWLLLGMLAALPYLENNIEKEMEKETS